MVDVSPEVYKLARLVVHEARCFYLRDQDYSSIIIEDITFIIVITIKYTYSS